MKLTGFKKLIGATENYPDGTEVESLDEMARPAKICPTCNKSMSGNHYWYKDGWRCKKGSGAAPSAPAPASAPASAAAPAPAKATPAPAAPQASVAPTTPRNLAPTTPPPAPQGLAWVKENNKAANNPKYTENPDGSIDVEGGVDLHEFDLDELPVVFGKVTGMFFISGHALKSTKGLPREVGSNCMIDYNDLESFVGSPEIVGGTFGISGNPAPTLEGMPHTIGHRLYAIEMPSLTSLHNIHKYVKSIGGQNSEGGMFMATGCPIQEAVLGLLLIRNLKSVQLDDKQVAEIINKHLAGERDIDICQDELIEAGKAAFAKL